MKKIIILLFALVFVLPADSQLNIGNPFFVAGVLKPAAAAGGGGTVTFDAVSSTTGNGVAASGSTLTTNSYAITIGSGLTDQYLVIPITIGYPSAALNIGEGGGAVTIIGVGACTYLGGTNVGGGTHGRQELWGIKNLSSGSKTIEIRTTTVWDGGATILSGAISFQFVDQTTPVSNGIFANGDSTTPAITVSSAANNAVVIGVNGGSDFSAWAATDRWHNNFSTATGGGCGAASSAAGAATVNKTWTMGSDSWAAVGINLNHD